MVAVSTVLTRDVEHLPGRWPLGIRVTLIVAANAALAVSLLLLARTARLLERLAPFGAVLALGLVVVSHTPHTQAECYVLGCAGAALLLVPWLRRRLLGPDAAARAVPLGRALVALALFAGLWPLGFTRSDFVPRWLASDRALLQITIVAAGALFIADRLRRRRAEGRSGRELALVGVMALLALAALWFRDRATALVAVPLWALSLPAGAWLWRAGRRTAAELAWLVSYVLVARAPELLFLFATLFVADAFGLAVAAAAGRSDQGPGATPRASASATATHASAAEERPRHAALVGLVALLFALGFVQRVGIELGLDFPSFDWTAGNFGDHHVSWLRIGTAIAFKHALARGALLFVCLLPLGRAWRVGALRGLLLVELGRVVSLTAVLFFCRRSFWTAMRVMGDLPHALIAVVVVTIGLVVVASVTPCAASGQQSRS
jgi:hypothetical protein